MGITYSATSGISQTDADARYCRRANNLNDVAAAATARTSLGLGTAAVAASGDFLSAQAAEELSGMIKAAADGTYVLSQYAKYAMDIVDITLKTSAGTVTVALNREGAAITDCGAIAASGTEATQAAGAASKRVAVGETLTLVLSSASSLGDLSYSIKATRV
jgi:hypothetical protein